jgi:hypothetical protein
MITLLSSRARGIYVSALLLISVAFFSAPLFVDAATINVADGDVAGLIAAIQSANSNAGPDTIKLADNGLYTLTVVDNNVSGPSGLPNITSEITIQGEGATIQRSSVALTPSFRIFHVRPNGDLTINKTTIRNGKGAIGAGIYNKGGKLKVVDSIVRNNSAAGGLDAGGIGNENGTAVITRSSIINNTTSYYAGGVFNDGGNADLTVTDSTISGNNSTAYRGGGLVNLVGTVKVVNSTISGNVSSTQGAGGIFNWLGGKVTLVNSTVSNNTSTLYAGGIFNSGSTLVLINTTVFNNKDQASTGIYGGVAGNGGGTIKLKNSIISNNKAGGVSNTPSDCGGTAITSLGHNIAGDATCALSGTADLNSTNPMLGALANNGGLTQTHMPLAGSPALNAIPAGDCTLQNGNPVDEDQRGVPRPQGSACDIGSVEKEEGLSWWPGNGNTNDVLGPNNGALYNGTTYTQGVRGQAFKFDGVNDSMKAPTVGLPTGNGDRTMELWARLDVIDGSKNNLASYGQLGGDSYTLAYNVGVNEEPGREVYISQWGDGVPGPGLSTRQWYHVVVANTGDFTSLYLDGVLVGSKSMTIQTPAGTEMIAGHYPNLGWHPDLVLNGAVDELRMYGRALTASEVSAKFNADQPEAMLANLLMRIADMSLVSTAADALSTPIQNGWDLLNDTNPNNDSNICTKLDNFDTKITNRLGSGDLTQAQADQLNADENDIRIVMGCSGVVLGAGALAHWPGDGTAEDVIGSNEGVLNNGATYATGVVGQAFNFDGTDQYFSAPTVGLPIGNANRTVSLWAKINSITTFKSNLASYGQLGGDSYNLAYNIGINEDPGREWYFSQWGDGIASPAQTTGEWHNVVVTNVGNFASLYIDGALVAAKSMTIDTPADTQMISGFYTGLGWHADLNLDGAIDELKVYGRVLSPIEIKAIYEAAL